SFLLLVNLPKTDSTDRAPVVFLQATVYELIPLTPPPRSSRLTASIPMDWESPAVSVESVVPRAGPSFVHAAVEAAPLTAERGVQADLVPTLNSVAVRRMIEREVRRHLLIRMAVDIRIIRSSLADIAGTQELLLGQGLSRVREMHQLFIPTMVEGDDSPPIEEAARIEGELPETDEDGEFHFGDSAEG